MRETGEMGEMGDGKYVKSSGLAVEEYTVAMPSHEGKKHGRTANRQQTVLHGQAELPLSDCVSRGGERCIRVRASFGRSIVIAPSQASRKAG